MIIGKSRFDVKVGDLVSVKLLNPSEHDASLVFCNVKVTNIRVNQIDLQIGVSNGRGVKRTISADNVDYIIPVGTKLLEKPICKSKLSSEYGEEFLVALDKFVVMSINQAEQSEIRKGNSLDCSDRIECIIDGDGKFITAKLQFINQGVKKSWGVVRENPLSPEQVQLFEEVLKTVKGQYSIDKVKVIYDDCQITSMTIRRY